MADHQDELPAHRDLLQAVLREFFQVDDPALLQRIEPELEYLDLAAGELLFREHDIADDIYFVIGGRLRAIHHSSVGEGEVLGEIARGETVGELALITGDPRSATVVAVRDSVVVRMSRETFKGVMAERPDVGLAVMRTVVDRFRRSEHARQPPRKAITFCMLPVSDGIDIDGFAAEFAAMRRDYGGPVALLTHREFSAVFSPADQARASEPDSPVARWLESAEAGHAALILVADRDGTPWTQRCLEQADEIVIVVRAHDDPAVVDKVAHYFESGTSRLLATKTLVLFHPMGARAATGTSAWLDRANVRRHFHIRHGNERDLRRCVRMLAGRGVGFVFAGGGARGFSHFGAVNALADAGIVPDVVGGVSIGAIVGSWCAMGLTGADLVKAGRWVFVENAPPTGGYNIFPLVSLFTGMKTREITRGAIVRAAGTEIDTEDTWVPYYCVAANYSTSTQAVLTRGSIYKNLLASFALPGALPPVIINGNFHVDGGVVNNMPVDVMERFGVRTIIAFDLQTEVVRKVDFDEVPSSRTLLVDRLRPRHRRRYELPGMAEIFFNAVLLHSVGHQREMGARADIRLRLSPPRVGLMDWDKYDDVVQRGYEVTKAQLDDIDPALIEACRV